MTVVLIVSITVALLAVILRSVYANEEEVKVHPNPKPVLSPANIPGFHLRKSEIHQFKSDGLNIILEYWTSDSPSQLEGNIHTLVHIEVYIKRNQQEALTHAEREFFATTDADQGEAFGKPLPGSYSGLPFADYCWAYKTSPIPLDQWKTKCLLLIKGRFLSRVLVTDQAKGVPGDQIDGIAMEVSRALDGWAQRKK